MKFILATIAVVSAAEPTADEQAAAAQKVVSNGLAAIATIAECATNNSSDAVALKACSDKAIYAGVTCAHLASKSEASDCTASQSSAKVLIASAMTLASMAALL